MLVQVFNVIAFQLCLRSLLNIQTLTFFCLFLFQQIVRWKNAQHPTTAAQETEECRIPTLPPTRTPHQLTRPTSGTREVKVVIKETC